MATIQGIPVYKAVLKDKGMVCVSLVERPAVDKDFEAYSKQPQKYAVASEDRRLVYGCLMRANYPIYRETPSGEAYYIVHTPELIREMAERYFIAGHQNNVDTAHNGELEKDCNLVQFFIKDSAKGVSPAGFEDIEDGSLFGEYHISNDEVWAAIKAGTYKGFSIEVFETIEAQPSAVMAEELIKWVEQQQGKQFSQEDMAFMDILKEALCKAVEQPAPAVQYGAVTTDKGIIRWEGEEDLKEGDAVLWVDAEGNDVKPEDGEYKIEDGKVIVVADGKVAELRDPEAEVAPAPEPVEAEAEPAAPAAEEAPAAEPVADEPKEDDRIEKVLEEIAKKIDEIDARIAVLEGKAAEPAAEPAHEAYKKVAKEGTSCYDAIAECKKYLKK